MLRLSIGSGMLRLSSCRLRLGLRLSIESCMLRLGLRLKLRLRLRLSFRGSGGLSMHELSLSMPDPMLSLSSMLILATTSVSSHRDGFRQPYSNFSNRPHPLAQNRGLDWLVGLVGWAR